MATVKNKFVRYISLVVVATLTALLLYLFLHTQAHRVRPNKVPLDDRIILRLRSLPLKGEQDLRIKIEYNKFELFQKIFKNEFPDYPPLEFEEISQLSMEEIQGSGSSQLLIQMASNTAPDILDISLGDADNFMEHNFLMPLNKFLNMEEYKWVRDFIGQHPEVAKIISRDNKIYAVPLQFTVTCILYRKDLFQKAGLPINRGPRDWDEFVEYLERLRDEESNIYGLAMDYNAYERARNSFSNFIWESGGEIIRRTPSGDLEPAFVTPEGARALNFYGTLVRRRLIDIGPNRLSKFLDGKSAMFIFRVGDFKTETSAFEIDPAILGLAAMPLGPDGHSGAIKDAGCRGINSALKNAPFEKQRAAFEFIISGLREEIRRLEIEEYIQAGYASAFPRDALIEYGFEEYIEDVPKWYDEERERAFSIGRIGPHGPNVATIYFGLANALERIEQNPDADPLELLEDVAETFREKLFGITDPLELDRRRKVVGVGMLVVGLGFVIFIFFFAKLLAKKISRRGSVTLSIIPRKKHAHLVVAAWCFMIPALLSVVLWQYYPLLKGSLMAFTDYRILGESKFIGIDNFVTAMYNPDFRKAMVNTIIYVGLSMGLGFFTPVLLALALSEIPKGKRLFRTLYYLPAVTTGLVVLFMWKWFYKPEPDGLFNSLLMPITTWLRGLGLEFIPEGPYLWLRSVRLAMISVILPGIWANAGPGCLIYLAALKSVPDELYEAADVDGAGIWRKLRHITFPMLAPLLIINFIGTFVASFQTAGNVIVMTGGGPSQATHLVGLEIWYAAFLHLKFGYATAVAWILGSMLIGFTIVQLNMLKRAEFRTARKIQV